MATADLRTNWSESRLFSVPSSPRTSGTGVRLGNGEKEGRGRFGVGFAFPFLVSKLPSESRGMY